jgi:ubiquinone biosynthesis protein UbiJ
MLRRDGKRSKLDGTALVRTWLATLAGGEAAQAPCTVHVVLIDTGQIFAVHVRGGNALLEAPRGHADAVLATSAASLHALVARRLTVDQALRDGLLVVDGDATIARRLASVARRR